MVMNGHGRRSRTARSSTASEREANCRLTVPGDSAVINGTEKALFRKKILFYVILILDACLASFTLWEAIQTVRHDEERVHNPTVREEMHWTNTVIIGSVVAVYVTISLIGCVAACYNMRKLLMAFIMTTLMGTIVKCLLLLFALGVLHLTVVLRQMVNILVNGCQIALAYNIMCDVEDLQAAAESPPPVIRPQPSAVTIGGGGGGNASMGVGGSSSVASAGAGRPGSPNGHTTEFNSLDPTGVQNVAAY